MKTHRHSCNYNLIGCESHLCEGLGGVGVNVLCPTLRPSLRPGDSTRATIVQYPNHCYHRYQKIVFVLFLSRMRVKAEFPCPRPTRFLIRCTWLKRSTMNMARIFVEKNLTRNVMDIHIAQNWCYNYKPWRVKEKTLKGYEEAVFVGLCLLGDQDFMRDI